MSTKLNCSAPSQAWAHWPMNQIWGSGIREMLTMTLDPHWPLSWIGSGQVNLCWVGLGHWAVTQPCTTLDVSHSASSTIERCFKDDKLSNVLECTFVPKSTVNSCQQNALSSKFLIRFRLQHYIQTHGELPTKFGVPFPSQVIRIYAFPNPGLPRMKTLVFFSASVSPLSVQASTL
jgi:hypothetical protein